MSERRVMWDVIAFNSTSQIKQGWINLELDMTKWIHARRRQQRRLLDEKQVEKEVIAWRRKGNRTSCERRVVREVIASNPTN